MRLGLVAKIDAVRAAGDRAVPVDFKRNVDMTAPNVPQGGSMTGPT